MSPAFDTCLKRPSQFKNFKRSQYTSCVTEKFQLFREISHKMPKKNVLSIKLYKEGKGKQSVFL